MILHVTIFSSCFSTFSHFWQSFDFLSLSVGVGKLDATESCGTTGKGLETLSQLQVLSHPSLVGHQANLPFSFPPSHYNSGYPDLLSSHQVSQLTCFFLKKKKSNLVL